MATGVFFSKNLLCKNFWHSLRSCFRGNRPFSSVLHHCLLLPLLAGAHVCDMSICRGNQRCFKDQLFHARIFFFPNKALALSCLFFCLFCTSLLRPLLCVFTFSSNQCLASYRGLWPVEATVSCRPPCYAKSKWSEGIPNRCWEAKSRRQTSEAAEMERIIILKKPSLI